MSAIQSLLRVMTLRDAEAIVLEAGKVPCLRRRGVAETLAMPALDAQLLSDFIAPLLEGRSIDDGPASVSFEDPSGASYRCAIDRTPSGLRLVVRPGRPQQDKPALAIVKPARAPAGAAAPGGFAAVAAPAAVGVPDASGAVAATPAPVATGAAPAVVAAVAATGPARATEGLARLASLLAGAVAIARERTGSDVIVSTGQPPRVRVEGRLEVVEAAVDDGELAACVAALGSNTDHSLEIAGTRLRVNAFDHLEGVGIVARLTSDRVPRLAQLALPPELASAIEHRDGLVLVCGPTGSGKSTTLAALIDALDQRRAAHVITLEDPVEYRFAPSRCLIHQRELGTHVPTFAAGVRAALREAPDVIVIGELRDRETIASALTAAETGHLVLATLHAPGAAGAIDRVIDAFPEAQQRQVRWQLAAVLRIIATQFLLPRRDGGRAVAVELVPATNAVANIIRKGDLHTLPTAIQSGREAGMVPLERSLAKLVDAGIVTPQAVKRIAIDHDLLGALSTRLR